MRYLGGKTQISKELAAQINQFRKGKPFWDPFCGSLAMSKAMGGAGIASDVHPALITLYRSVADGWDPPRTMSKEEWAAAKTLPDTDPLKGFAGFGCSFRGLYFSGYAGGYVGPVSNPGCQAAREVLLRDVQLLKSRGVQFECLDFFDVRPQAGYFLYLDPPYVGTASYAGTEPFDHERFYRRVSEWATFGPVCISEYTYPTSGRQVWEKSRARKLLAGTGKRALEKLFVVGG